MKNYANIITINPGMRGGKSYILFALTPLLLGSCASQFMTSSLTPQSISEATIINPATHIELVPKGKGNRSFYSDSLTYLANRNVEIGLSEYLSGHFQTKMIKLDNATTELVHFQLFQMRSLIEMNKKIEFVEIPPSIDSIMTVNNIDYAVCAIHNGFSREKGNYGAQVAKGILLGIVTLGYFYTVPVKALSDLTICIIDRKNSNIAFHNRIVYQDIEPIEKRFTDKQIRKIVEKYLVN